MKLFHQGLILNVIVALVIVCASSVQCSAQNSMADRSTEVAGLFGLPDGNEDNEFIVPDAPSDFSAPATPLTTQVPPVTNQAAAARKIAYDVCLGFGGTADYCQANADASASELIRNCTNDPYKCCTDLPPSTADQILGRPGACDLYR